MYRTSGFPGILMSICGLVIILLTSGCMTPPWKKISISDTGFSSSMPAQPEAIIKDYPSAFGNAEVNFRVLSYKYVSFTMSVTDFPEEYVKSSTVDTILVSARDGAISEVDGELISEKIISLNVEIVGQTSRLPGREITYSFGEKANRRIAIARIYLGGNHLFQLHGSYLTSGSHKDDVIRFISSGKISKQYKALATEKPEWKELVSKNGRFKILAVGTPLFKNGSKNSDASNKKSDGGSDTNDALEKAPGNMQTPPDNPCYFFNCGGSAFAISWADVSKSRVEKDNGKTVLNEFIESAISRFGSKPQNVEHFSLGKAIGKEFSFIVKQGKTGYLSRCRFVVSSNRVYQMAVTSPATLKDMSEVEIFLKSFQIID